MSLLTPVSSSTATPAELIQVTKALGPRFGYPHKSTAIRWITRGIRTATGQRVRLTAWRRGTQWFTSREAVEEFARAVLVPSDCDVPPRTTTARQRASEDAAAELRALGM
jgi:hypothetical protein